MRKGIKHLCFCHLQGLVKLEIIFVWPGLLLFPLVSACTKHSLWWTLSGGVES